MEFDFAGRGDLHHVIDHDDRRVPTRLDRRQRQIEKRCGSLASSSRQNDQSRMKRRGSNKLAEVTGVLGDDSSVFRQAALQDDVVRFA